MRGNARRPADTRVLYLIGDDGCDKSALFEFLELEQEELNQEINVYVKLLPATVSSAPALELYDFPTDRMIRGAMAVYLRLLPPPSSLLYFTKEGASERDICEWVRLLQEGQVGARLLFLSDVTSYLEREKILTRLAREFEAVLDATFFLKLEPCAFRSSFGGLRERGVAVDRARCLRPTLARRVLAGLERTARALRRRCGRARLEAQSVV